MKRELKMFDNPKNVQRLLRFFFLSLVVLLIADFFIHKHPYFYFEGAPEFFATYGFVSCVLLIFMAKGLRRLLKRDENYYKRQ